MINRRTGSVNVKEIPTGAKCDGIWHRPTGVMLWIQIYERGLVWNNLYQEENVTLTNICLSTESCRSYSLGYSFYNRLRVLIEHNRATSLLTNTCSVTSTFNFILDVCIVDQVVSDPSLTLPKPCSSRWETRFGNVDIVYEGVSNWEAHKIYHTNFDI